jgi:type IV pilus assembly protein PilO
MKEKFLKLTWQMQLLVMIGAAALVYLGIWYSFTSVTRAEAQTLEDEVAKKISQNEAARIATQRIDEFRALYAKKSQEYDDLKIFLPEQRELTNVLQGLQDTASEGRLSVMRFSPREEVQQDGIMAKAVEVEVESDFAKLRAFFEKMAKLQRIVSISDFKIDQIKNPVAGRTLHAQFLLTAYYASQESLNQPKPEPEDAKGKKKPAKGAKKPKKEESAKK